jgi:hypothetical protein
MPVTSGAACDPPIKSVLLQVCACTSVRLCVCVCVVCVGGGGGCAHLWCVRSWETTHSLCVCMYPRSVKFFPTVVTTQQDGTRRSVCRTYWRQDETRWFNMRCVMWGNRCVLSGHCRRPGPEPPPEATEFVMGISWYNWPSAQCNDAFVHSPGCHTNHVPGSYPREGFCTACSEGLH